MGMIGDDEKEILKKERQRQQLPEQLLVLQSMAFEKLPREALSFLSSATPGRVRPYAVTSVLSSCARTDFC